MDFNQAKLLTKQVLTKKRFEHSLRVCEVALDLHRHFPNVNEEAIKLAAIFHDYAKCFSKEKLKQYVIQYNLPKDLLNYHHELWHGPVASKIIKQEFGIEDQSIQSAIYYHTTGRTEMGDLDYIIFVADYIEPKRDFPIVDEVRKIAKTNIYLAFHLAIKYSIYHLMQNDLVIHPDSFKAYNFSSTTIKER